MPGLTPFRFDLYHGLPPDGAKGQFWGFDEGMHCYLLRWNMIKACWDGIGFDPHDRSKAFLFFTKPGDSLIVAWSPAPLTRDEIKGKRDLVAMQPEGYA